MDAILGLIVLVLWLGCGVLTVFATAKIISKAGYSVLWILVPLAPVFVTIVSWVVEYTDFRSVIHGGTFDFTSLGVVFYLDILSMFVAWLFFIIFAFSSWPALQARRQEPAPVSGPPTRSRPGVPAPVLSGAPAPTSSLSGMNAKRFGRTPAAPEPSASVDSSDLQTAEQPTVVYCQWCGKERAVDALSIHHCGPKDRPVAFCTVCGASVTQGATDCASCGAVI
jgi:hypothetical protein